MKDSLIKMGLGYLNNKQISKLFRMIDIDEKGFIDLEDFMVFNGAAKRKNNRDEVSRR